ncbi:hypothetical protein [Candidatus Poriferisocius sp.]|uniref:hypothetical protein n=1 Tax=Candidatus Poriferisocius sp. TaxID=3101276 RepID=UPI003B02B332
MPASALSVAVTVSASGDFGAAVGSRTVTVPISGRDAFAVSTAGDSADEADGSVTATLVDGTGYDLGTAKAATVAVAAADDPPPPQTTATITVEDASGPEGGKVVFRVTLSEASSHEVAVNWVPTTLTPRRQTRCRDGAGCTPARVFDEQREQVYATASAFVRQVVY